MQDYFARIVENLGYAPFGCLLAFLALLSMGATFANSDPSDESQKDLMLPWTGHVLHIAQVLSWVSILLALCFVVCSLRRFIILSFIGGTAVSLMIVTVSSALTYIYLFASEGAREKAMEKNFMPKEDISSRVPGAEEKK